MKYLMDLGDGFGGTPILGNLQLVILCQEKCGMARNNTSLSSEHEGDSWLQPTKMNVEEMVHLSSSMVEGKLAKLAFSSHP